MSDDLTDDEIDNALSAIALVRLALKDLPKAEATEQVVLLINGRDDQQQAELIFHVAELAATILDAWWQTMIMIVPEEQHNELKSPEEVLDELVKTIINGEPPEEL